jgi:ATP-binding cassette subfamily F protein 3
MTLYTGGYDQFEAVRREQQRLEMRLKKKQDDDRRRLEAFVDRFRAKASKARQAQSRLKVLSKMKPIADQVEDRVAPFLFPEPQTRLGNPLIRLDDVSVGYEEAKPILRGLDLRIDIDDRIGLLGSNGNGKSTLAKLLIGQLAPMEGFKKISKKCQIGYFAQHQMDELNDAMSPYDVVANLMPEATEAQKRAKCAAIGFGPDKADTKAGSLSGGEKARLLFAIASFHGPHLLVLDEPTNHLDVDSCEMLIHAINEYDGAVLIISHDRHLLEATVDRLWLVEGGAATPYEGDMESYRTELLRQRGGRPDKNAKRQTSDNSKPEDIAPALTREQRQEERRLAAEARALLAPKRKQLKKLESEIGTLQERIKKIDDGLSDMSLYERDPEAAKGLGIERGKLQAELEAKEEDWLTLGAKLEAAGG